MDDFPAIAVIPQDSAALVSDRTLAQSELCSLVRSAQSGDHAAFEALVIRHERRLLRLAYRMLGNLEEAKDACQEVLVKFHRYIKSLDPERDPAPWLHQLMVNVCHDHGRKRQHIKCVPLEIVSEVAEQDDPDPIEMISKERRSLALSRALAKLPAKERAALVLRDVEGRSAAEAAKLLGSSEPTVRSQACRGRIRLKQLLEEES